jgi:hypothetical protein
MPLCVDEDYESGDAFEIGMDKANKVKGKFKVYQDEDSEGSFERENSSGNKGDDFVPDLNMNDFLNQSGNRRRIQTANRGNLDNKRNVINS